MESINAFLWNTHNPKQLEKLSHLFPSDGELKQNIEFHTLLESKVFKWIIS